MAKENNDIPEIPRITKAQFMERYDEVKDSENLAVNLIIHMPDDCCEIIFNPRGHNKVDYIDKTYDENLTHKGCKDIYIVGFEFYTDKILEYGFDAAIKVMQRGKRVSRSGWNGKGQFIYFVPEGNYDPCTKAAAKYCTNKDGKVPYRAYIAIKTVDGSVVPWVASQTDILAQDWYTVYE